MAGGPSDPPPRPYGWTLFGAGCSAVVEGASAPWLQGVGPLGLFPQQARSHALVPALAVSQIEIGILTCDASARIDATEETSLVCDFHATDGPPEA